MTRCLLIECGAAETRAALIDGDEVLRFWFGPARGDEALSGAPNSSDIFRGRVRSVSKPLGGAFVDLGDGPHGFLPLGAERILEEGAAIIIRVRRPAIGSKGPVLSSDWKKSLQPDESGRLECAAALGSDPARLSGCDDAALQAMKAFDLASGEILVDRADVVEVLRGRGRTVTLDDDLFEAHDAEAALEASLERVVRLEAGARMIFDETEAMTVVDVDAGAAADGATGRLNDKVNEAAARRLFEELSRRSIGGRIIVDFLPPSGAPARQALLETLRSARRGVFECRLGRLSSDGLFDATAPRERRSLLEHATETAGADWPRCGRRLTLDWQAKAAMRALERTLRANRSAQVRLFAGAALHSYLGRWPQWRERLAQRFGGRFEIAEKNSLEDRGFDIAGKR